jgi:hypothetical protein
MHFLSLPKSSHGTYLLIFRKHRHEGKYWIWQVSAWRRGFKVLIRPLTDYRNWIFPYAFYFFHTYRAQFLVAWDNNSFNKHGFAWNEKTLSKGCQMTTRTMTLTEHLKNSGRALWTWSVQSRQSYFAEERRTLLDWQGNVFLPYCKFSTKLTDVSTASHEHRELSSNGIGFIWKDLGVQN